MKMRLPAFFPPVLRKKKKLRASAAARGGSDFEDMSEPNMKLSRALLIVLVLHVVAVAGIIAFNAIKSRQGPAIALPAAKAETKPTPTVSTTPAITAKKTESSSIAKTEKKSKPSDTVETGKSYIISKGDTPTTIARKFKITTDELLSANKISDPHKLKIGQKLVIPMKIAKAKGTGR